MHTSRRKGRGGSRTSHRKTNARSAFTAHKKGARNTSRNTNKSRRSYSGGSGRSKRALPSFDPTDLIRNAPAHTNTDVEEVYEPQHQFDTFGFSAPILQSLNTLGMTAPTPIQDRAIPHVLKGRDVLGLAETGTGKTAAFLLPLVEATLANHKQQALILTPTRELAIQIEDELKKISRTLTISSVTCVGGVSARPQIKALHRTPHFIIGTPGRVLDLIRGKHIHTKNITAVVLDEADRMLDMGFIADIRTIVSQTPRERQTLLFSATLDAKTRQLVDEFLIDPVEVSVRKKEVVGSIEQSIVHYDADTKFETLLHLLENPELKRVVIFGAMKHSVKKLAEDLSKHNILADSIHGNKTHTQRQRALAKFKSGNARVLVATDVAARGIHVDNVTHVINYDLPGTREDYVHRIGRTGRAEKRGKALTLIPRT